jgi:hypothetical protein
MAFPLRVAKVFAVAILYALGALTSIYLVNRDWQFVKGWALSPLLMFTPLPFIALSVILFMRTWKAALIIPLNFIAWSIAYTIASHLSNDSATYLVSPYLITCLASITGGLGVTAADSLSHSRLLSSRYVVGALLITAIAGLPFGTMDASVSRGFWNWARSLIVWQSSLGTYLYYVCTSDGDGHEKRRSQKGSEDERGRS